MRDTEREAETQAEGEAGAMQGARRGTQSRNRRITPPAKGRGLTLSHLGVPTSLLLKGSFISYLNY